MSKRRLIGAMATKEWLVYTLFGTPYGRKATSDALRAIDEMPDADPYVWIPVTETMPEMGVEVMVTLLTSRGNRKITTSMLRRDGSWAWVTSSVVAWMPLPQPYKND